MIVSIKEKMVEATVGSVEIFLSSDGQSIPFGTNWLHKIEDGLKNAQLMFVFVTENSLSSGWIYYEAGFAYSKGIRVIPVAIGVDIASSGAPLSLLQGYNLVSEDSLNNFIHIINSEFALSINESAFVERDFQDVMNCASLSSRKILFKELVSCIDFSITADHITDPCISNECIDKFFNDIVDFFDVSNIPYSRNKDSGSYHKDCIVANGIRIEYDNADKTSKYDRNQGRLSSIYFSVSIYNFEKTFALLVDLLHLYKTNSHHYIRIHLFGNYEFVHSAEDGTSILSDYSEFEVNKNCLLGYKCNNLNLEFYIEKDTNKLEIFNEYIAAIGFDCNKVNSESIMCLIDRLYNIGFIVDK